MALHTPETHPDHDVIGQKFRAHGVEWLCDSYDPAIGYWMTPADPTIHTNGWGGPVERTNVSERAIGRTYHRVR